jgi:CRP-like cAMP-binding protein
MPTKRRSLAGKSSHRAPAPGVSGNKLLAALPPEDYRRLQPKLGVVPLKFRQVLQAAGEPPRAVYFPADGVCSIVTTMADGRMIEVATVGNEGMVGIGTLFGADHAAGEAIVQIPGAYAHVISIDVFASEMERRGSFYTIISRYAYAMLASLMQSAACNGLHSADRRCARWLLQSHDRIGRDTFALTQDFLSVMLGVRRATVTVIINELQRAGLIRFQRGIVTILDRQGLEAMSCECYRVIKEQFNRIV